MFFFKLKYVTVSQEVSVFTKEVYICLFFFLNFAGRVCLTVTQKKVLKNKTFEEFRKVWESFM